MNGDQHQNSSTQSLIHPQPLPQCKSQNHQQAVRQTCGTSIVWLGNNKDYVGPLQYPNR